MKPNKLTPGANVMWKSSRMMLPEHVEEILEWRRNIGKKERPILDDDRFHELSRMISEAHFRGDPVTVTIFSEFDDTEIVGKVTRIDTQLRRIKVVTDEESDEYEWVPLEDIVDIK